MNQKTYKWRIEGGKLFYGRKLVLNYSKKNMLLYSEFEAEFPEIETTIINSNNERETVLLGYVDHNGNCSWHKETYEMFESIIYNGHRSPIL